MKTEFSEVKAVAGSYSAAGHTALYRKRLAAQGRLDIAGGAVGVPFAASGPTRQPEFRIAKSTIGGAITGPPDIEKEKEPSRPKRPRR